MSELMKQIGLPRPSICKAGRARELMDEQSANDFDAWCKAKNIGKREDPQERLATLNDMANAIAVITGVEISTKTLSLHYNDHCVCER